MLTSSASSSANGPVKWCKKCSRQHESGVPCELTLVWVKAKSGRLVQRWLHPERDSDDE